MPDARGFVVVAKRPNPYKEYPWDCETVSMVLPLAQAQDSLLWHRSIPNQTPGLEYEVWEMRPVTPPVTTTMTIRGGEPGKTYRLPPHTPGQDIDVDIDHLTISLHTGTSPNKRY